MTSTKKPVYLRIKIRSIDDDNKVFFSNEEESAELIEVIPGAGMTFPKVDALLPSMEVGERDSIQLEKADAFGDYLDHAIKKVPINDVPEDLRTAGTPISTQIENDQTIQGIVLSVDEEFATIDFNHPLAGKTILVDFVVVEKTQ